MTQQSPSSSSSLRAGASVPSAFFFVMREGKAERISSEEVFGEGRSLLFGMPGAFTPTCSKDHLPSVLRARAAFGEYGVERIACMTTQDPFVMEVWRKSYGELAELGEGGLPSLLMLSDASGEATRAFRMEVDLSDFGLGRRCRRFAAVIEGGVVRWLSGVEARGECRLSDAGAVQEALAELDLSR